jgi:1,4-dihydroxy-2-naphthoyl-CoA hydrolase
MQPFTYRRRVRLKDTDAAGVVFFVNPLVMVHEAFEACLDAGGVSIARILKERVFALPIVEATTKQRRPLRVGDDIDIELSLEKLGASSLIVCGTLKVGDDVVGTTRTVHVAVDHQGVSCPLPTAVREAVAGRLPLVAATHAPR